MPSQRLSFQNMLIVSFMVVSVEASTVRDAWRARSLKETRQDLTEGMLGLGTGWTLASCSWLFLDFWRAPSKKPLFWPHPSSCRRHPWRILPIKMREDISFRHPRLWLSSLELITVSIVILVLLQGLSPSISHHGVPGSALLHECTKFGPTDPPWIWSLKGFERQVKSVESCINFGGGKGYFLWEGPLGSTRLLKGKSHILETVQTFLIRFL